MIDFSERLLTARKSANISQSEMARLLNMPFRTYQKWEMGLRVPPEYVQSWCLAYQQKALENR